MERFAIEREKEIPMKISVRNQLKGTMMVGVD
jgi:hypothetical protein